MPSLWSLSLDFPRSLQQRARSWVVVGVGLALSFAAVTPLLSPSPRFNDARFGVVRQGE